jgi:hypothetical protein
LSFGIVFAPAVEEKGDEKEDEEQEEEDFETIEEMGPIRSDLEPVEGSFAIACEGVVFFVFDNSNNWTTQELTYLIEVHSPVFAAADELRSHRAHHMLGQVVRDIEACSFRLADAEVYLDNHSDAYEALEDKLAILESELQAKHLALELAEENERLAEEAASEGAARIAGLCIRVLDTALLGRVLSFADEGDGATALVSKRWLNAWRAAGLLITSRFLPPSPRPQPTDQQEQQQEQRQVRVKAGGDAEARGRTPAPAPAIALAPSSPRFSVSSVSGQSPPSSLAVEPHPPLAPAFSNNNTSSRRRISAFSSNTAPPVLVSLAAAGCADGSGSPPRPRIQQQHQQQQQSQPTLRFGETAARQAQAAAAAKRAAAEVVAGRAASSAVAAAVLVPADELTGDVREEEGAKGTKDKQQQQKQGWGWGWNWGGEPEEEKEEEEEQEEEEEEQEEEEEPHHQLQHHQLQQQQEQQHQHEPKLSSKQRRHTEQEAVASYLQQRRMHDELYHLVESVQRSLDKIEALSHEKRKVKRVIKMWNVTFERQHGRPATQEERKQQAKAHYVEHQRLSRLLEIRNAKVDESLRSMGVSRDEFRDLQGAMEQQPNLSIPAASDC